MHAQQVEVVAIVAELSVADTEQAAGVWRQRAEALVELPEPVEPDRQLRTARTADGLVGRFVLDDAGALQFEQAIRQASTWDGTDDTRDQARRRRGCVGRCLCVLQRQPRPTGYTTPTPPCRVERRCRDPHRIVAVGLDQRSRPSRHGDHRGVVV